MATEFLKGSAKKTEDVEVSAGARFSPHPYSIWKGDPIASNGKPRINLRFANSLALAP
jgi:hypothetical protein